MYSTLRQLVFLLYTLLYIKTTIGIFVQDQGYIYKQPKIKFPFLSITNQFTNPLTTKFSSLPAFQRSPPPSPSQINYISSYYQDNFVHSDNGLYYTEDGRLLKQYDVMERIIGDLQHPDNLINSPALLFSNYFGRLTNDANTQNNYLNFNGKQLQQDTTETDFYQPVTRNHGPVALGSGSLGYIRLSNGAAYLGSGSLGYISGQQANQAITDAKTRKGISPPGPLHFGHGFDD